MKIKKGILPISLNSLTISNNEINELPSHFSSLKNITRFVYNENPIKNINSSVKKWLKSPEKIIVIG
jgi:Leucine-rich repeat (LRR) protein